MIQFLLLSIPAETYDISCKLSEFTSCKSRNLTSYNAKCTMPYELRAPWPHLLEVVLRLLALTLSRWHRRRCCRAAAMVVAALPTLQLPLLAVLMEVGVVPWLMRWHVPVDGGH